MSSGAASPTPDRVPGHTPGRRRATAAGRASGAAQRRPRAAQGDGERLRGELVDAAERLLVSSGNPEHVTLRAVARAVGVAAPSIYLHFADRDALLAAVLELAEARFAAALAGADPGAAVGGPTRLRAIGRAYVVFATEQKGAYQVLFNGLLPPSVLGMADAPHASTAGHAGPAGHAEVPGSFGVLLDVCTQLCGDVGPDASGSGGPCGAADGPAAPMALALQLWSALHGYVTLRVNVPMFPWPEPDAMLESMHDSVCISLLPEQPGARGTDRGRERLTGRTSSASGTSAAAAPAAPRRRLR